MPIRLPARALAGATLASVLLGVACGQPASAAPEPGGPGIGDAYYPLDGNGGIDVQSYDVDVDYRFGTGRLRGVTTLEVVATQDLSRFNLDLLLPVRRVRVDGRTADFDQSKAHELRIDPRQAIRSGDGFTVRVRYAGKPGRHSYSGESNWLADEHEVVTMNEPHMAPWWFPSNDHPQDKAPFDISVTVPRGNQVVANGRPAGRTIEGDDVTVRWRAAEPMAPYLAFFAAGHFQVSESTDAGLHQYVAVSDRLPDAEQREGMQLLKRSSAIVRELEDDLGPYPFSSTGGLATYLSPGFALENQTRPTYDRHALDEATVVHELAHQWFGDSVSVHRWRDIWLNEGFATFFELRYDETHGGDPADTWLRLRYEHYERDSAFWDRVVADPGAEIHELFSTPVYVRGAMTVQALRNRIGEADFWETLQRWVADRADGNGTTRQLQELAEEVSGEDLEGFFDAWVRTGEKPADTVANGLG